MNDTILSLKEAASFLQVATDTVETLLDSGQIAGRRIEGEWRTTSRALLFYVDGGARQRIGLLSARMLRARQTRAGGGLL